MMQGDLLDLSFLCSECSVALCAGTAKRGSGWTSPKTRSSLCTLSLFESFRALTGAVDELHDARYTALKTNSGYGKAWNLLKLSVACFHEWSMEARGVLREAL